MNSGAGAPRAIPTTFWFWSAAGLLALAVPALVGEYGLYVVTISVLYGVVALALNVLTGYAGQLSLGHAGFFAIGAYGTGILTAKFGWPYFAALMSGALVAAALGVVLAFPALRLAGLYLAIATLGFGEVIQKLIYEWKDVTGGGLGLKVPRPDFGFGPVGNVGLYYTVLGVTALVVFVLVSILNNRAGRAWVALRDSEAAAAAMGVDVARYKVLAFVVSGFFTAIAGGLYAPILGTINSESFNLLLSIDFLAMIVFGGMASVPGSFIGAFFVMGLPEALRAAKTLQSLLFGVSMVLIIILFPGGMVGLFKTVGQRLKRTRQGV